MFYTIIECHLLHFSHPQSCLANLDPRIFPKHKPAKNAANMKYIVSILLTYRKKRLMKQTSSRLGILGLVSRFFAPSYITNTICN